MVWVDSRQLLHRPIASAVVLIHNYTNLYWTVCPQSYTPFRGLPNFVGSTIGNPVVKVVSREQKPSSPDKSEEGVPRIVLRLWYQSQIVFAISKKRGKVPRHAITSDPTNTRLPACPLSVHVRGVERGGGIAWHRQKNTSHMHFTNIRSVSFKQHLRTSGSWKTNLLGLSPRDDPDADATIRRRDTPSIPPTPPSTGGPLVAQASASGESVSTAMISWSILESSSPGKMQRLDGRHTET